jgi:hypothetical protein
MKGLLTLCFTFLMALPACNIAKTSIDDSYFPTVTTSFTNSILSTSSLIVSAGDVVTLKLDLRDQNFNPYISKNMIVSFQALGGTSTGTISDVVDNLNGTYTANFLGVSAGTPTTIHAFVNGTEIQSSLPSIQVNSGFYSVTNSILTLSASSVSSGSTVTATLRVYDTQNNPHTTGGLSVQFSTTEGSSNGAFSSTTDHNDGTYSAVFTGTTSGTPTTIKATINGHDLSSSLPTLRVNVGAPGGISIVSGNNLSGPVGTTLDAMSVVVKDINNNVIPGATVDWTVVGGTLAVASTVTDASGIASNTLTFGTTSGTSAVTAMIHGTSNSTTFNETANSGQVTHLIYSQDPSHTGNTDSALSVAPSVTAKDQYENTVNSFSGSVFLSVFSDTACSNPILNGVSAAQNPAIAVNGTVNFSQVKLLKTNIQSLQANDGTHTVCISPFNISPGAIANLAFTQQPSTPNSAGAVLTQQPWVTLYDSNQNIVSTSTAPVNLSISSGTGNIFGTNPKNASSGVSKFTNIYFEREGNKYLRASVNGTVSPDSKPFYVNSGTASSFAFAPLPSTSGDADHALSQQPIIKAYDAFSNLSTSYQGNTITFVGYSDNACSTEVMGGVSSGTPAAPQSASGVTTFSSLKILKTNVKSVRATDGKIWTSCVSGFNILPGVASSLSFSTQPSGTHADTILATQPQLTFKDANGNIASSTTDSVSIALYSDSSCSTPLPNTPNHSTALIGTQTSVPSSGIASFTDLGIRASGTSLFLKATSSGGLSTCSNAIAINPGAFSIAESGFSSSATTLASDSNVMLTLTAKDTYGNGNPSGVTSVSFTTQSNGGTLAPVNGGSITNQGAGVYSAGYTGALMGNLTLGAKINGNNIVSTLNLSVTQGPAYQLSFITQPSDGVSGVALGTQPSIQIKDKAGNPVTAGTDASATITLTGNSGITSVIHNTASAISGLASFSNFAPGSAGTGTLMATAVLNGITRTATSNSITIDPYVNAPTLVFFSSNPTSSNGVQMTPNACATRYITKIFLSESNLKPSSTDPSWQTCSLTSGSIQLTLSALDGIKTLYAYSQDKYGNISLTSSSYQVVYDTTVPSLALVSLSGGQTISGSVSQQVTWTATDGGSGLKSNSATIEYFDGTNWVMLANNQATSGPYTWPASNLTGTNYKVRVTISDQANNLSTATSNPITIDSTPPIVSLSSPTGAYRGGTTISVALSASDALSGMSSFKFQYASGGTTFVDVATLSNTATSYNWTLPTDNTSTAKIRLLATDAVGNQATATSSTFTIDSTPPAAPSVTLSSNNPTNSTSAAVTVASCVDRAQILISESSSKPSLSDSAWVNCSTLNPISYTLSAANDGTKTLYIYAQDTVGNISNSSTLTTVLDRVAPIVTLTSLTGGQVISGLQAQTMSWTATDDRAGLLTNSAIIDLSSDGGNTWSAQASSQPVNGPLIRTLGSSYNGTQYRVRVRVSDNAGNVGVAISGSDFTIDSISPASTSSQMTVNGSSSGANTSSSFVNISYKATDNLTNITQFCFKYNVSTAPTSTDTCWVSVSANPPGLTPSPTFTLSNYSFQVGRTTGLYSIYAWIQDVAGNISSLSNSGNGTLGTDLATINYTTPNPPALTNVIATSSENPSEPSQTSSDLRVTVGNTVYIQWKVTSTPNSLATNPISIEYATDNTTFTSITTSAIDGANACTPDSYHTGCYKWTNGAPTSNFFSVKVKVTDSLGMTSSATSAGMNSSPPITFLAGSTDLGTNGAASSAAFVSYALGATTMDTQSFVVTTNGIIYFRDQYRGILKVDPATGNQTVLIPITSAASFTDGALATASVKTCMRLALDYQDRLLLEDVNSIRRYDPTLQTVTTIIGGPTATATATGSTTQALSTKFTLAPAVSQAAPPFFATPDGKIYFATEDSLTVPNVRIRIYDPSTLQVSSLYLTGTGHSGDASADLSTTGLQHLHIGFSNNTIDTIWAAFCQNGHCGYTNSFNNSTGVTLGGPSYPAWAAPNSQGAITGMNGEIYSHSPSGSIRKYNKSSKNWTTLAGNSIGGVAADGNSALTSPIVAQDLFVSASGSIYFFERGRIRMVDQNGKIQTIAGISRSFGDGGLAMSARIGDITDFKLWNNGSGDKITFIDNTELRFRQFSIGGNITTIAGNGSSATPNTTQPASSQPLAWDTSGQYTNFLFQVDPSNGDLYAGPRGVTVSRLGQSTGVWTDIVGNGSNRYFSGDGLAGNQILNEGYAPMILGFDGMNLLVSRYRYNAGWVDSMLKLHSVAAPYIQSAFAGVTGSAANAGSICALGTSLTACRLPPNSGFTGQFNPFIWDSYGSQWVTLLYGFKDVYSMIAGGTIAKLTSLSKNARSFTYRHDSTHNIIYYCSSLDYKLHSRDVGTGAETDFTWPVPNLQCASHSLVYSPSRNSIIFAYSLMGLFGFAEYAVP